MKEDLSGQSECLQLQLAEMREKEQKLAAVSMLVVVAAVCSPVGVASSMAGTKLTEKEHAVSLLGLRVAVSLQLAGG